MLPGQIPVNNGNVLLKLLKKKKRKCAITQTIIIFYNRKNRPSRLSMFNDIDWPDVILSKNK